MAGTTINEDNLVYKTLHQAINAVGFELSLAQVLELGAGKEKKEAIRSLLTSHFSVSDEEMISTIYEKFIHSLTEAYQQESILPQPHVLEVFNKLRNRNIYIVLNTGYDRKTADTILNKLGWKEGVEFDGLVTASDVERNRPEPDMILFAMKRFGITDSRHVVKVGDSSIDILEGQNAGCGLSIGITTGAHSFEQLKMANPDKIINDLAELVDLIN